ncbi:MAG: hypothetical protein QXI89_00260 [Candidatus Anstonellales archaeon]
MVEKLQSPPPAYEEINKNTKDESRKLALEALNSLRNNPKFKQEWLTKELGEKISSITKKIIENTSGESRKWAFEALNNLLQNPKFNPEWLKPELGGNISSVVNKIMRNDSLSEEQKRASLNNLNGLLQNAENPIRILSGQGATQQTPTVRGEVARRARSQMQSENYYRGISTALAYYLVGKTKYEYLIAEQRDQLQKYGVDEKTFNAYIKYFREKGVKSSIVDKDAYIRGVPLEEALFVILVVTGTGPVGMETIREITKNYNETNKMKDINDLFGGSLAHLSQRGVRGASGYKQYFGGVIDYLTWESPQTQAGPLEAIGDILRMANDNRKNWGEKAVKEALDNIRGLLAQPAPPKVEEGKVPPATEPIIGRPGAPPHAEQQPAPPIATPKPAVTAQPPEKVELLSQGDLQKIVDKLNQNQNKPPYTKYGVDESENKINVAYEVVKVLGLGEGLTQDIEESRRQRAAVDHAYKIITNLSPNVEERRLYLKNVNPAAFEDLRRILSGTYASKLLDDIIGDEAGRKYINLKNLDALYTTLTKDGRHVLIKSLLNAAGVNENDFLDFINWDKDKKEIKSLKDLWERLSDDETGAMLGTAVMFIAGYKGNYLYTSYRSREGAKTEISFTTEDVESKIGKGGGVVLSIRARYGNGPIETITEKEKGKWPKSEEDKSAQPSLTPGGGGAETPPTAEGGGEGEKREGTESQQQEKKEEKQTETPQAPEGPGGPITP